MSWVPRVREVLVRGDREYEVQTRIHEQGEGPNWDVFRLYPMHVFIIDAAYRGGLLKKQETM